MIKMHFINDRLVLLKSIKCDEKIVSKSKKGELHQESIYNQRNYKEIVINQVSLRKIP